MTARGDATARRGDGAATGRDEGTRQPDTTRPRCTTCRGRGWVYSSMDLGGDKDCPTCKGSGWGATATRQSTTHRECNVTGCDGIGVIRGGDFFYCEDHETESWDDDATTGDTT